MTTDDVVQTWRSVINGPEKSWVLFENGTCVILLKPQGDLAAEAVALLREWGPVRVGSASADFSVIVLPEGRGWAVTCHHPDILSYVAADEMGDIGERRDHLIGLRGRSKRDDDAKDLRVVHVEDKRGGKRAG